MTIKLIAIDLDDTLLKSDLQISPETREVLSLTVRQGTLLTLATGRMFKSALKFARDLEIDIPLITYQGAMVKKALTGEEIFHLTVPGELALRVLEAARPAGCHYQVYFDDDLYLEKYTQEGRDYAKMAGVEPVIEPDLLSLLRRRETTKLLFIDRPETLIILEGRLKQEFGHQLYITRSKPYYLEVMHPEATKGRALQAVASYYGLKREEVMAIGDSYNDIDMVKWAGLGVAMGNAPSEVKQAADYVTASNDDDGVARAIRELVLAGRKSSHSTI